MPSKFDQKVFQAVSLVPKGMVTTYKLLAHAINCKSCQAVGQALRRNPFAPKVPCHRVIKTDLTPGGFMGAKNGHFYQRKIDLLRQEGVFFKDGRLQVKKQIFDFPDWQL